MNTGYKTIRTMAITLLLQFVCFDVAFAAAKSIDFCWKTSYGRGAGDVGEKCPAGQHLGGLLCYDNCPAGYTSNKAGLCVQNCGTGYRDDGLFCRKAEYHVKEYPWNFNDPLNDSGMFQRCEAVHGKGNCWKPLLVVVEKCQPGFEHVLGFCRPAGAQYPNCVADGYEGQFDLSCSKKLKTTPSHSTMCENNQDKDGALCYKKCGGNAVGVGPVCWVNCPAGWVQCGAGCAQNGGACAAATSAQVLSVFDAIISTAVTVATVGGSSGAGSVFSKVKGEIVSGFKDQFTELASDSLSGAANGGVSVASTVIDIVGYVEKGNMDPVERDWKIAQTSLEMASMIDPTGFVGVAAAFAKPVCNVLPQSYNGETSTGGLGLLADGSPTEFKRVFANATEKAEFMLQQRKNEQSELERRVEYILEEYTHLKQANARLSDVKTAISCIRGCKPVSTICRTGTVHTKEGQSYVVGAVTEKCFATSTEYSVALKAWNAGTYWKLLGWNQSFLDQRESKRGLLNTEQSNLMAWIKLNGGLNFNRMLFDSPQYRTLAAKLGLKYLPYDGYIKSYTPLWVKIEAAKEDIKVLDATLTRLRINTKNSATLQAQLKSKVAEGQVDSPTVTAALTRANGKATYLFYSDGTYAKTSANKSVGFDTGYPTKMPGGWRGIPAGWYNGINAAVPYENTTKGYMWNSGAYLRLSDDTMDSGYPTKMPGGWKNMPVGWGGNVDASIYYPPNKKHYFFKGNEYVRLSGVVVDAGYPAKLPGGWIGMPADFVQGIDAATFRNNHTYMIKGDSYIRFTNTKVDAGYPKSMSRWPE